MAASSQYHRGAPAPHSHYHPLPGNHEHLYADLATPWNSSHGASHLSRDPAPSALLHRLSSPAHRPPAHYLDYSGSSDYVNPNPPSTPSQPQWSANYPRPASRGWSHGFNEGSFTARSLSYSEAESRLPAPHVSPLERQLEALAVTPHNSNSNVYRPQENDPKLQEAADLAAAPNAPPYPTPSTLAPLLNYANPDLNIASSHAPSQAAMTWASEPNPGISPVATHHAFSHTVHALPPDAVLGHQGPLPGTAWAMVSSGPSNPVPAGYGQLPEPAPIWHTESNSQDVSLMLPNSTTLQAVGTNLRGRRSQPKKAAPKVPAAFVPRAQKSKVSRRSGPLSEMSRAKTHLMRKEKNSCMRCRFYKAGCDCHEICRKCLKVQEGPGARSFLQVCCRDRIEDAMFVRHCNGRSNQEEGEFINYEWIQNHEVFQVYVTWHLPGAASTQIPPFVVRMAKYRPRRHLIDAATNEWNNTEGRRVVVKQAPYAVYDTQNLIPALEQFFSIIQPYVEQWTFSRSAHDEIAYLTIQEAIRLRAAKPAGKKNLLDLVLRMQCLSVVSQGYGSIVSEDVPGIQEYDYSKLGRSQYEAYDRDSRDRPLPGAVSHQVDVAFMKLMKKWESDSYRLINDLIFKGKIKPWYEVFIGFFIILWNLEYVRHSAEAYIQAKNGTTVESNVNNVVTAQIKRWEMTAKNIWNHCNAVMRDFYPFRLARENPNELRLNGHVDAKGFEYLVKVTSIADRIGGIGQSTSPYCGPRSLHNSLASPWISDLLRRYGL